jgi:hypothetical protein
MKKTDIASTSPETTSPARRPYTPPRIEKRQAVARVTLLSGMGAMGVGVISMMN